MLGDIYQVTNEFIYQGNPNQYSFHLRLQIEGTPATVNADMLAFGVLRETAWLPLHNPSVTFRCVTARQVFDTNSLPQLEVTGNSGNRTCIPALDHLPGQCSCVAQLFGDIVDPTAFNRGRDFVCGQCCDDQLDGEFTAGPGYIDELCLMYATMTNIYVNGANTYDIGIYSPSRAKPPGDPPPPPIPPFFWPLQHVRTKQLVRTQRRRQPLDPCEVVCDLAVTSVPPI